MFQNDEEILSLAKFNANRNTVQLLVSTGEICKLTINVLGIYRQARTHTQLDRTYLRGGGGGGGGNRKTSETRYKNRTFNSLN